MKTPALDAPMTDLEVAEAFGAWNKFKLGVAERAPANMIELLEALSPIVDDVFELRKTLNAIWQRAEDRHYGRSGVVKPFRRGVSPKSVKPRTGADVLMELGLTTEQLETELAKLGLLPEE